MGVWWPVGCASRWAFSPRDRWLRKISRPALREQHLRRGWRLRRLHRPFSGIVHCVPDVLFSSAFRRGEKAPGTSGFFSARQRGFENKPGLRSVNNTCGKAGRLRRLNPLSLRYCLLRCARLIFKTLQARCGSTRYTAPLYPSRSTSTLSAWPAPGTVKISFLPSFAA